jgi:hypothetical protein
MHFILKIKTKGSLNVSSLQYTFAVVVKHIFVSVYLVVYAD